MSSFNFMFHLFSWQQPPALPPLTLQKTSPSTSPPSPAERPTGGPGTAAWALTFLSPPMCFQSTPLGATCPRAAWATSSLLLQVAPGACLIPPLPGEVTANFSSVCRCLNVKKWILHLYFIYILLQIQWQRRPLLPSVRMGSQLGSRGLRGRRWWCLPST